MFTSAKAADVSLTVDEALSRTRESLLALRGPHGHWFGELAASALSTATAVVALEAFVETQPSGSAAGRVTQARRLVDSGVEWLVRTQNADGGWGDTVLSNSNISTTALVWAALARHGEDHAATVDRCTEWLQQHAGSLEPEVLARAVERRYGKDRTFSIPILTTLTLTGRLGPSADAWKLVAQLPFELAACPHQWFARLKLPVVSYALPALIAMGQVRHRFRPTFNPVLRLVRRLTRSRTLRVLESIQPASGGFLEATPLTSFVVLSLVGAGEGDCPVVGRGVEFLIRSARPDGSWPIDTDLATWVTTLAVNALSASGPVTHFLSEEESCRIRDWLLGQQYQIEHPYTHAAPGGWAWTDLTGGVPDADDTPGALLALWHLAGTEAADAAENGVRWLLDLQNSDGGLPTFCRGWGLLPFDRSSADLTAHTLRAWWCWYDQMPRSMQERIHRGTTRALRFLQQTQRADGAWAPLWFGNQHAPQEENLTYGTSRVLLALATLPAEAMRLAATLPRTNAAITWLLAAQNDDGGWGGEAQTPSSIEETALAVEVLSAVCQAEMCQAGERDAEGPRGPSEPISRLRSAIGRGTQWLIDNTGGGTEFSPSPIGFYFAKLWYYEKLYPIVFSLAALGRVVCLDHPPEAQDALSKSAPDDPLP